MNLWGSCSRLSQIMLVFPLDEKDLDETDGLCGPVTDIASVFRGSPTNSPSHDIIYLWIAITVIPAWLKGYFYDHSEFWFNAFFALAFVLTNLLCLSYLLFASYMCLSYFSERRQAEAARIQEKYPDRIPVGKFDLILCKMVLWSSYRIMHENYRWVFMLFPSL